MARGHMLMPLVASGDGWSPQLPVIDAPHVPRVGEWFSRRPNDPWRCVVGVFYAIGKDGGGVAVVALADRPDHPPPPLSVLDRL